MVSQFMQINLELNIKCIALLAEIGQSGSISIRFMVTQNRLSATCLCPLIFFSLLTSAVRYWCDIAILFALQPES